MKLANLLSSLLFTIGLYSCATSKVIIPEEVQFEFKTMVSIIQTHCSKSQYTGFGNYEIEMVEKFDKDYVIGQCYAFPGSSYRRIQIRRDYWEATDDIERMALIAHEMIHCSLNQPRHVESPSGHIMNSILPYFSSWYQLINHLNDYVRESCKK